MSRERSSFAPALTGSLLLHAGVAVLVLISMRFQKDLHIGPVVPVTLVTSSQVAELREAIQAPEVTPAQTPEPDPVAPPAAAAPAPAPTPPAPPAAPAKSQPAPNAGKQAPTPTPAEKGSKVAPKTSSPGLDLDALAASIAKSVKPSGPRTASGIKGPARPEQAPDARQGQGAAVSSAALNAMANELQRRWNPNCEVVGGSDVVIKAAFTLSSNGRVIGEVEASGETSSDPVVKAASDRARRAVRAAEPFVDLPPQLYGQRIVVNFNARQACALH